MDTLEGIDKLAQRARLQDTPAFSVSRDVAERLEAENEGVFSFAVFDVSAGVFAAAASILFYLGMNTWMHIVNPLAQFFAPLQEIRLW